MNNRRSIVVNLLWRFAERCGAQLVTFLVSLILARLLEPEVYGTIALVTVFITILNVFIDSGMANALIQKKDADNLDFSSMFYFNITVCCLLYLLMFLAAPLIAAFYEIPELTPVVRVLSLTLIISGLKNVQQAYVSRTMQFKRFFFATLGGTVGAAVVGILMAYRGLGIWALVAQQLFNTAVDTLVLWITVRWRPRRVFSFERLKGLLSYGWKLLVSALLDTVYNNIRQLIIGKLYTSADLAYFNRGKQFPNLFITNVNSSIDSILLPTMSREQDDKSRMKDLTRRAIKTSTYIMAPLMVGLACCAVPLIRFLLTDKWLPAVPFMRIMCVTRMFYPIHTANLNAIKAMGRSDIFLKLEVIKKVVGAALLLGTMWFGVYIMAYSLLAESLIAQMINASPNKKLLDYGYGEQLKDILPGILLALFMGACIIPVMLLGLPSILTILIQIVLGMMVYLVGSAVLKLEAFRYLWDVIRPAIRRLLKKSEEE